VFNHFLDEATHADKIGYFILEMPIMVISFDQNQAVLKLISCFNLIIISHITENQNLRSFRPL